MDSEVTGPQPDLRPLQHAGVRASADSHRVSRPRVYFHGGTGDESQSPVDGHADGIPLQRVNVRLRDDDSAERSAVFDSILRAGPVLLPSTTGQWKTSVNPVMN